MLTPAEIDALDVSQPSQAPQGRSLVGKILKPEDIDEIPAFAPGPDRATISAPDNSVPTMRSTTAGGPRVSIPDGGSMAEDASDFGPVSRAVTQALPTAGRALGYAGRFLKAGVADIASTVRGEPAENLETMGTDVLQGGEHGPLSVIGATGKPSELPIEQQTREAALEKIEQHRLPWEAMLAGASQQLTGDIPKFAVTAGAGEGAAMQGLVSGGVFGMDENGEFHPREAAIMALLPGVGKMARMGTASIVGRGVAAGIKGLDNPAVQKVVEEVGHQVGMDAYMTLANTPELIDQYKKNPNQAVATVAGIVAQNLGFMLLGANRFRQGVPSDTQSWIQEKANTMAEDIVKARVAQDYTGPQLREIYQRVNSNDPAATPEEKELVSFINSQMGKGQKSAFKSGVRVTTTEFDYDKLPEFWKKYVPKQPTRTMEPLNRMDEEDENFSAQAQAAAGKQAQQPPTPAAQPAKGRSLRLLLPEEIDAIGTEQQQGGVQPQRGGTVPQQPEQAPQGPAIKGGDTGNRVPDTAGQPAGTPAEAPVIAATPQPEQPAAPAEKPEVAKLSSSKSGINKLGDPYGTLYYGTPEDHAAYVDLSAQMTDAIKAKDFAKVHQIQPQIEAIKNKYGGMPPEPPKAAQTTPPAATPERKAGDLEGLSDADLDAMLDEAEKPTPSAPAATEAPAPSPAPASQAPAGGKGRLSRVSKLRQMLASLDARAERMEKKLEVISDTEVRGKTEQERRDHEDELARAQEGYDAILEKVNTRKAKLTEELRKAETEAVKANRDVKVTQELHYGVPRAQWDVMSAMTPKEQKEKYGVTQSELMQKAILEQKPKAKQEQPTKPQAPKGKPSGRSLKPKPAPKSTPRPAEKWTTIGKNAKGRVLQEDENGVRSYIENGVRVTEPVEMIPTLQGVKPGVGARTGTDYERFTDERGNPVLKKETTREPAPAPKEKTAADIAADAAKAGVKGIDEAIKGLHDLFGGGAHMGSGGPGFDEETYKKAKPHFENAYEQFKSAGKSLKEFLSFIFEKFGAKVRPYIKRFIQELQAGGGKSSVSAPDVNEPAESPSGNGSPGGTKPEAPGPVGKGKKAGTAAKGPGPALQPGAGPQDEGATGQSGTSGGGVPNADAAGIPTGNGEATTPEQAGGAGGTGGAGTVQPGTPPAGPAPIPEIGESGPANLHFTEAQAPRGLAARADANIAAIELVKKLEAEKRFPTDEERLELAKWSGWGSFKELFNEGRADRRDWDQAWVKSYGRRYDKLKKLLTPQEFNAAAESSVNAHFTGPDVVIPMWDLARRLGFKGGRTLESSAGSGNFLGFQPKDLARATQWTAVEMEPMTGRILSYLYPKADARIQPFEETKVPNGFYEMAIGNVPFHETGPGKEYPDLNLHNYFIARMLDKVRPGGLVIAITTSNTMEARAEQRRFLASKGQLVGAIRLPNNAFKESAGTEVTTDILVLRKPDGKPFDAQRWENQVTHQIGQNTHPVNEYFVSHPEMVLGQHALTGTMYREKSYTVEGKGELGPKLAEAIARFPENITQQGESTESLQPAQTQHEDFTLMLDDKGRVMEAKGFKLDLPSGWDSTKATLVSRAKRYIKLRDVLSDQYDLERSKDATDEQIEANRKKLNAEYKKWVKEEGTLNLNNRRTGFLRTDPRYFMVMGLENVKEIEDPKDPSQTITTVEPADVLKQRVILPDNPPQKVENATDALSVSMSYKGRLDMDYMKALSGLSDEQIEAELIGNGTVFKDPETSMLVPAADYISGDVRDKLAKAIFAARESDAFARNVEALRAAVPESVPFERIAVGITARWTPIQVVNKFAANVIGLKEGSVSMVPKVEEFSVKHKERYQLSDVAKTQWSTDQLGATQLLEYALNMKRAEVRIRTDDDKYVVDENATALANQMIKNMAGEYENYVRTTKDTVQYRYFDADKGQYITDTMGVWDAMEREFNKRFNSFVDPKYDGSVLKLPGLATWVRRSPHLVNAVMRGIMAGSTVYGHGVGSGKTLLGIVLAHEMRRIGLTKKFVHVVKKPTVDQWRVSIERAYPGSKMLVPSKADFEAAKRKKLIARIASGNWDFIVLSHEQFKMIKPGEDLVKQFYDEQADQLRQILRDMGEESAENAKSTRGMVPAVRNIVKKLKSLKKGLDKHLTAVQKTQDAGLPWERLGVDGVFVDESHNFKKMPIPTQIDGEIKGIPSDFSQRAVDLLIKIRSIQQRTEGRNVFFASGTPVSNTLAELWVQFHATNPNLLKAFSVETFDSFATAFANVETNFELGWDGTFKDVTRMARFKNPAGLTMLTRLGMDVRMGNKELGLDVPELEGGKPIIHIIKPTRAFRQWLTLLEDVSAKWNSLDAQGRFFNSWIPITVMRAGVAAALDPRCLFEGAEDDPNSKVNQAVRHVIEEYHRGAEKRTTMMIFADMYRRMNTEKLMAFVGGHAPSPIEIEAKVEPVNEEAEEGEEEGDKQAAKDEDDFVKNSVGAFNLYDDIRKKLIAAGVPQHEIGVMIEHESDSKRESLFNKIRSGQVRILIGSTEKIGEGVDVPQRMSAQFHLDPPMAMTPAKLEQRMGRIIRQGNLHSPKNWNLPVRVHFYAQERSMDAAIYQMLQYKGEMNLQAIKGQFLGDSFEDPASELTVAMAEMMAAATGDNRAIELAKLKKEVRDLSLEEGAYQRRMSELRRNIDAQTRASYSAKQDAAKYRTIAGSVAAATQDPETMVLTHVRTQDRIVGEKAIKAWLKGLQKAMVDAVPDTNSKVEVSLIVGNNVRVRGEMHHRTRDVYNADGTKGEPKHEFDASATIYMGGPEPTYTDPQWSSALSTFEGLLPALKAMPAHAEQRAVNEMAEAEKAEGLVAAYTKQFNSTHFDKADELKEKEAKLNALEADLRGPQLTSWQKMVNQTQITAPPLHVRIMSEMQRVEAALSPLLEREQGLVQRLGLATGADHDALKGELDDVQREAFDLESRMHDLERRLATVEKARLGSARAGTLANLPYGRTQTRRPEVSYDITEPGEGPGAEEIRAKGAQELRTLLEGNESGLSDEARRVALDLLKQPAMQGLAWNRLNVAIKDRIGMVESGQRQGKGFSGTADVANWLIELSRGAKPETFPHEVFHFLYEMLPQADKDRLNELRLDALQRAFDTAKTPAEQDAILHYLQSSHPGMTSTGFISLWEQIAAQHPGVDLNDAMRQMYRLVNPSEFLAHVAGEDFAKASAEARQRSWFDEFFHRIKTWFQGLMDTLRKFLGQKKDIGQIIREMLGGKNLNTPEGGLTAERTISGELEEEPTKEAADEGAPSFTDIEMKGEMEKALAEEDQRSDRTRVFGRVDRILGREGLGPAERAAGAAFAKTVFDKVRLQVEQQENGLWKLMDERLESEIEGRNLLKALRQEIATQDQPGKQTGYLGNLLNSVRENMVVDRIQAFSPSLKKDLYSVAQGEASQRGLLLAALGGFSNTVQYVARNVDVVLSKTYSDAFDGDFIRSIVERIATNFRDYFTEKEIEDALRNSPQLADLIDRALALNRRDEGGRVYRRAQNLLKPKGRKTLATLEADARITEAVEGILEQLKREGIEPQPNPNKPLAPLHRLLLMVHPATAEKIDALMARAVTHAMENAGKKHALNAAEDEDEREDLQQRFAAGEKPSDEDMEAGLDLPEFAHWKVFRDNMLGYNPVTLKLAQDLVRSDFRGTRFKAPAERIADTRLDLEKLAKKPDEEVERVLNAYLTNLNNSMDMSEADDGTKQRILAMVEKLVSDQLESARSRARSPMFAAPKAPGAVLTPEQRIGELLNAGLFRDERLDVPEMVQRVASKSPVQRLTPKMPQLVRDALDVPFYRQAEVAENFAKQLTQRLGVSAEQAENAMEVFIQAFKAKFKTATETARKFAQESLTPAERKEAGPRKALWKKVVEATNAGIFDSSDVLKNIARAHGWAVPTDADVQKMHALAEQIQRLSELSTKEREMTGDNPKDLEEARLAKLAATSAKRIEIRKQIETRWARMVRPISFRHWWATRRNIAAAMNEFEVANLLLKIGFPIRLATHITTQLCVHTPTRAIAEALVRFQNDKATGRETRLWADLYSSLGNAYADTLKAVKPALEAARAALAGRAEARNVDRLLSGVQAMDRMSLQADELAAKGDHVRAGLLKLLALVRISLKVTQALDNFQGTPAEAQEMRGLVITALRENGRSPAEAEMAADEIIGNANEQMPQAVADVTAFMESNGITPSGARVIEAARELVKQRQYARMAQFGLPADDFRERIRLLRRTIAWQERTTTGFGGVVATAGKTASAAMEHIGLPLSFTRFSNAFGTGINYMLMFTPLYATANARIAGSDPSPWFKTETDRMQRRVQALIGSIFGAAFFAMAAMGGIIVRLSWPTDKRERELLEAQGHRLGTVEVPTGEGSFIPISMSVGPMSLLAPYLAAGGSLHDLLQKREQAQQKLDAEAAKTGLPAGKIRPMDTADLLGVALAGAERALMGGRSAVGLSASVTEYGVPNSRKTVAAYLSPLVPGLPAYQELTRMAGINLDSKLASVWDFMVPLPTSQARAVNLLGDPVKTPDDVQRIVQTVTAGTYPWNVSEANAKQADGYAALFNSGYRPPAIDANKGFAIDGEWRPMNDSELARYTVARGQALKSNLAGMANADEGLVKSAYEQANEMALQSVGVNTAVKPLTTVSSSAGGTPSSIMPATAASRFVPPGAQLPTVSGGAGGLPRTASGAPRMMKAGRSLRVGGRSVGAPRGARGPSLRRGGPMRSPGVRTGIPRGNSVQRSLRPRMR